MPNKTCTKCGIEKDVSEFYKNKTHKDGLRSQCKQCMRGYYYENREEVLEYAKKYQKNRKKKIYHCVNCDKEITSGSKSGKCASCSHIKHGKYSQNVCYYCELCGKKITSNHKRCVQCANKGRKHTKEHNEKIRQSLMGKKHTKERIEKNRKSHIGIKQSEATIRKRREALIGRSYEDIYGLDKAKLQKQKRAESQTGMFYSTKTRKKLSLSLGGTGIPYERMRLTLAIRYLSEYNNWRTEVFKRDNYTCQECGQQGGYLESHHKKEFHIIFTEFLKIYDQFSPINDKEILRRLARKYNPFWELTNGKTLCQDCHNLTKTGRRK